MSENPSYPAYPPAYPPAVPQTSTMAIVSLVSGIASWLVLPTIGAVVAVVTGHMARNEIRQSGGQLTGDGLATAGLVLGYLQIGLTALGMCLLACIFVFAVATSGHAPTY